MNFTHFKIEFVFKRDFVYKSDRSHNFYYEFSFENFKGMFVIYCDRNIYSIEPEDVEENKKTLKFEIPLNREIDSNYFFAKNKFTFRSSTGSVNLYLIPFGILIDRPFALELTVKPYEFSEAFITIHPFPNKPNPELSTQLNYHSGPHRKPFHKMINSKDCPQEIVINQLSQLPTLLEVGDLLSKERAIITIKKTQKIQKIQEKFIVAKNALEDLFEILATIYRGIEDLSTDIADFREQEIEQHEKTRKSFEQEVKEIVENQTASDLMNYLIHEKTSVKDIMKRVRKNIKDFSEDDIEKYFKSLEKTIDKYAKVLIMFDRTRGQKIIRGLSKVVGLISGKTGEWGVERLLDKIVECFEK